MTRCLASLVALVLVGCGAEAPEPLVGTIARPIPVEVYASAAECAAAGRLSSDQCRRGAEEARAKHPAFAMKYGDPRVCAGESGVPCAGYRGGDAPRYFAARPTAFLACLPADAGCPALRFDPVYPSREHGSVTGISGGIVSQIDGRFSVGTRALPIPVY